MNSKTPQKYVFFAVATTTTMVILLTSTNTFPVRPVAAIGTAFFLLVVVYVIYKTNKYKYDAYFLIKKKLLKWLNENSGFSFVLGFIQLTLFKSLRLWFNFNPVALLIGQLGACIALLLLYQSQPKLFKSFETRLFTNSGVCHAISLLLYIRETILYPFVFELLHIYRHTGRRLFYIGLVFSTFWVGVFFAQLLWIIFEFPTVATISLFVYQMISFLEKRLLSSVEFLQPDENATLPPTIDTVSLLQEWNDFNPKPVFLMSLFVSRNNHFKGLSSLNIPIPNIQRRYIGGIFIRAAVTYARENWKTVSATFGFAGTVLYSSWEGYARHRGLEIAENANRIADDANNTKKAEIESHERMKKAEIESHEKLKQMDINIRRASLRPLAKTFEIKENINSNESTESSNSNTHSSFEKESGMLKRARPGENHDSIKPGLDSID